MSVAVWGSLFFVCLLGAMSPGPSLAMVTKHALSGGRANGIATAWAHACGIGIYAFLTITGLTIVLHQARWLFTGISLVGALYLVYLGCKALRANAGVSSNLESGQRVSIRQSAKEGLFISMLNPKIALFFMALFSQFVAIGHDWSSRSLLIATPVIVDGLWYTIITLLMSSSMIVNTLKSKAKMIDRVSGVVLIALAIRVVTTL